MDSALLAGMMKLGVLSAKPSAGGLGLAMSSSITTRVGWGTQSSFSEGPSSGPWVVLDRRFRVEGRWMRLKGSRHKCSGSGDLVCEDHVACWGGEAGGWLWIESRWLLRCRRVVVSSWGTRGTMWAVITSSSTTARTLREAFSKGEGAARDCSLGRLGLLAPHSTRARGWRHRRGRPGGLESPGKSMGKAAAPGSPWGIPGCSRRLPRIPGLRRLPPPAPLSLSIIFSRAMISLHCQIIFHCMGIPQFIYPCIM